jgi:hypothetical protein
MDNKNALLEPTSPATSVTPSQSCLGLLRLLAGSSHATFCHKNSSRALRMLQPVALGVAHVAASLGVAHVAASLGVAHVAHVAACCACCQHVAHVADMRHARRRRCQQRQLPGVSLAPDDPSIAKSLESPGEQLLQ